MKKLAYILLFLLPVVISAQDQKPISTATICFYRPHRFEGSALKPPLFVDDIDVAHLHNGDACASPKPRAHVKSITYKGRRVTCYMDENRLVRSFGEGQGLRYSPTLTDRRFTVRLAAWPYPRMADRFYIQISRKEAN